MLRDVPRALHSLLGTPRNAPRAPREPQERSERPQERSKSPQQRSESSNGALRALQSSGYARKRVAASILRFVSGERARVRANGISAQPLCTNQETRSRSKPERARARSSERARELASERARERKSERAREQERERAGERESERVGERVSEAAQYHQNKSLSKREQSELRSYRAPSPHSNLNKTLCIKCTGQL